VTHYSKVNLIVKMVSLSPRFDKISLTQVGYVHDIDVGRHPVWHGQALAVLSGERRPEPVKPNLRSSENKTGIVNEE
jgi:hypothetical protein